MERRRTNDFSSLSNNYHANLLGTVVSQFEPEHRVSRTQGMFVE